MKSSIVSRFAVVSGLVVCSAFGLATVARAGEGGTAGSAAFTIEAEKVTGVAVSAAVGKENASAAAFNYAVDASNKTGVQNSAWSLGTAGVQNFQEVGHVDGLKVQSVQDGERSAEMTNSFSADPFNINLGSTGTVIK